LWGALSDERTGLSFVHAAAPFQGSLSRVRVPWVSRLYFTVSDLRLPFSSPPTTRRVTVEIFDPPPHGLGIPVILINPRTDTAETQLALCCVIVASTEVLLSNASISCCRNVFTAALRGNEDAATRLGTARHSTEKTPLSLLLRNRPLYRFLWLSDSCVA
jgi:hypothetical protein